MKVGDGYLLVLSVCNWLESILPLEIFRGLDPVLTGLPELVSQNNTAWVCKYSTKINKMVGSVSPLQRLLRLQGAQKKSSLHFWPEVQRGVNK